MFFRHYRYHALMLLPVHGRFSRLWRYLRVVLGFYDDKDKLVAWHRAELEKLDSMFRAQQNGFRLVAAREKALAEGIGPMDQRYPDILDFHSFRPHGAAPRSGSMGSAEALLGLIRKYKK